jgi:DNA-binding CsgD family transcriptional regulator
LEVQALTYAADVSGQHLHWKESVEHGLRAIALAKGNENHHSAVLSRWWTSVSLLSMGDLDGARPHSLALLDLAEKQSTPRPLSSLGFVPIISLSCLEGDWKAGREYSNRSLKVAPPYGQILGSRVLLEYETGEFAQGEVYLERLLEVIRHGQLSFSLGKAQLTIIALLRITGDLGRLEIAEAAAEEILSEQSMTPIMATYAKAGLALLAVQKDDQSAAAEHYAYFRAHRGTMIWTVSSVDRLLGLLSQTMGNMDQATLHFEHSLAFCARAGYRPELAWTCHDYAGTLLRRNASGDQARAAPLLAESLATSTQLGMRPLMERVAALQERVASQPARPPAYPAGLTHREVEVLRLVAAGKTSVEIASELILSRRTVERHISNIYSKTNSHNRSEVTAFAFTQGLMWSA